MSLFIMSKYNSSKEEITNYIHLPFKEYEKAKIKVNQYINTKNCESYKSLWRC